MAKKGKAKKKPVESSASVSAHDCEHGENGGYVDQVLSSLVETDSVFFEFYEKMQEFTAATSTFADCEAVRHETVRHETSRHFVLKRVLQLLGLDFGEMPLEEQLTALGIESEIRMETARCVHGKEWDEWVITERAVLALIHNSVLCSQVSKRLKFSFLAFLLFRDSQFLESHIVGMDGEVCEDDDTLISRRLQAIVQAAED
jgi:hypothetical protein